MFGNTVTKKAGLIEPPPAPSSQPGYLYNFGASLSLLGKQVEAELYRYTINEEIS